MGVPLFMGDTHLFLYIRLKRFSQKHVFLTYFKDFLSEAVDFIIRAGTEQT